MAEEIDPRQVAEFDLSHWHQTARPFSIILHELPAEEVRPTYRKVYCLDASSSGHKGDT